jgi:hypothetical protein
MARQASTGRDSKNRLRRKQELDRLGLAPLPKRDSVLYGMASILDLFGQLMPPGYREAPDESDAWELYNDHLSIARDFWKAIDVFEAELPSERFPQQEALFDAERFRRSP